MTNLEKIKGADNAKMLDIIAELLSEYSNELLYTPYNCISPDNARKYAENWLKESNFKLIEKNIDLFKVPGDYVYAHCISSDFVMGAGIALEFAKRRVKDELLKLYEPFWKGKGYNRLVQMKNHTVCNLVTKQKYSDKPTYDTLKDSLIDLKEDMKHYNYTKLAMPKIGCGLDKLEWDKVKEIITDIFSDTDIEILICIKD